MRNTRSNSKSNAPTTNPAEVSFSEFVFQLNASGQIEYVPGPKTQALIVDAGHDANLQSVLTESAIQSNSRIGTVSSLDSGEFRFEASSDRIVTKDAVYQRIPGLMSLS